MEEKEKEKKEKTPAHISQHEDMVLKATAQFFQEEIMPVLNIEGTVVSVLPTEGIHLELRKGFEDFNYLMSDDTIKHFEFQSTNEGKAGLKRFRMYESQLSYQHGKAVTTYVLFSGNIQNPMTEYTEGINTYRIQPIIMKGKDADAVIAELKRKIETKEELTKADLLPLVLCPLMGGAMSQKERISAAYDITRNATGTDAEVIRKVEALVYVMADKFLEKAEMEQLKEEIKMTTLGKMLYDDGVRDGEARGEVRGEARGKAEEKARMFVLIRKMTADGELEAIPKLTTDSGFYETMLRKYNL